ncbi:acyl-CoA dehydrogenase family protein [Actinoplanes sp. NPDC049265]|uniref:acyl-CoA dehydrogenase family protein n=1 Tax=Actinoplanes sp. NPDC049265 TaxID=3363902 RepID=UPI003723C34C
MNDVAKLSTEDFINNIKEVARSRFDWSFYPQQTLPAEDWKELVEAGVFLPVLTKEFGGRDSHEEMTLVLESIAEYNLPLAFYAKVTTAVALRPIIAWGTREVQQEVLPQFASGEPITCGLAMTEPGGGSALAGMTTTFSKVDGGYRIKGRKHWQGFSTTARWWIVCAREEGGNTFGYFVIRRDEGFETIEKYDSLGMKVLDYGLNEIDAFVPEYRRLNAYDKDLSAAVEVLMAPRSLMPAMGAGFLRRVEREALSYATKRPYGRKTLAEIPFVKYRLDSIKASSTICEALHFYATKQLDMQGTMIDDYPQVQALKTVATENMISAANHYIQISGGEGYRHGSPKTLASQAFLDTRVFTIFDGNNDLLSQQLAQWCLKREEGKTLTPILAAWPLTSLAMQNLELDTSFLDKPLDQGGLVLAGRLIAYVFAAQQVLEWEKASPQAVSGSAQSAIKYLKAEIQKVGVELELAESIGHDAVEASAASR